MSMGQLEKQVDSTETPPSGNSLTRCYGKYGCFSVGEPFLSIQRPLNLFPLPPESLNVQFFLRTRRNNEYYQRLKSGDADSFADSKFDSTRPTMFIIHGYLEHGYLKWILDMSTELLTKDNYNVIVVDWSQAAQPPYTQAVANARMVGALVADMIMHIQVCKSSMLQCLPSLASVQTAEKAAPLLFLSGVDERVPKERLQLICDASWIRYSVAGSDFHLIGYNVGAHIAGYAGERVKGIGRITGLDPADPYFANTDKVVRLDPSDADFVDVIHTGGSSFDASPREEATRVTHGAFVTVANQALLGDVDRLGERSLLARFLHSWSVKRVLRTAVVRRWNRSPQRPIRPGVAKRARAGNHALSN
ncbi:hypothetical protein MTO96_026200 [Rhipicephalus appendiculatus]